MKKIHNMKNLILCILLIGVLCATLAAGQVFVYAEDSSSDTGMDVAEGLVDVIPDADRNTEGETSIIKDEPASDKVEQALSDDGNSSDKSDKSELKDDSKTETASDTDTEKDPEPDYYQKLSDNDIRITAEIEEPSGELKVADPDTLVEAPRIDDPYNQYDTIGDGVNYLVTIPKKLGFVEKDDGSYESDRSFTVWSNLNDDQIMVVKVSGDGTDNVVLRDHRGTGEAVREVTPFMVDLNWDATKSLGDKISTSGAQVSIAGAGEFTARSKLVSVDGESIGAGRWAGPMVFSVEILPGLTEEQEEMAEQYAMEHPELQ